MNNITNKHKNVKMKWLVIGIGAILILLISGFYMNYHKMNSINGTPQYAKLNGDEQIVSIDVKPKEYAPIVVQKGISVTFIIHADSDSLNSCNSKLVIPDLNISKELSQGENRIQFTPQKIGKIKYSCSMGMIKSYIKVVENIKAETAS